jgi:hypothetical protein
MSDIEDRIGIVGLDELLARRQELTKEAASLYAVYGPFGTAEHRRKIVLAMAELRVRADLALTAEKATEGKVDAMARTHAMYLEFIDAMEAGRAEWLVAETKLQSIADHIQRGNALMRFATQEVRL